MKKIAAFVAVVGVLCSCTTDSVSDLADIPENENVTYLEHIKPIIDNNCISCHGTIPANGAPMSLTTYQNVRDAVLTRNLIDRISRADGVSGAMPFGGPRMPQANIELIIQWSEGGFLE